MRRWWRYVVDSLLRGRNKKKTRRHEGGLWNMETERDEKRRVNPGSLTSVTYIK